MVTHVLDYVTSGGSMVSLRDLTRNAIRVIEMSLKYFPSKEVVAFVLKCLKSITRLVQDLPAKQNTKHELLRLGDYEMITGILKRIQRLPCWD